ncbi:MAG: ABC transporter ATP-binding protein [Microbacterium sp.]
MSALLDVQNVTVQAKTSQGRKSLVRNVSFSLRAGETIGIIGESGSGKTTLARSLLGLLHHNLDTSSGTMTFEGRRVFEAGRIDERAGLRGNTVGFVFQSTVDSLDPLMRVGNQIVEVVRAHNKGTSKKAARERGRSLLGQLGFIDPEATMRAYPHQLSGGMKQRVGIAIAIITEPKVIIADEPTSALDLSTQAEVVGLLAELQKRLRVGMIFVTHDLNLAGEICTELIVMKNGNVVDSGPTERILSAPSDEYTVELLAARPAWTESREDAGAV